MKTIISLSFLLCFVIPSYAAPATELKRGEVVQNVFHENELESTQKFVVLRERITKPDNGILKVVRRIRAKGFPSIRTTEIFWMGQYFYTDTVGTRMQGSYTKLGNTLSYVGTFSTAGAVQGTVEGFLQTRTRRNTFGNILKYTEPATKVTSQGISRYGRVAKSEEYL